MWVLNKHIKYTRHSSGGWQVFVGDRCFGTVVAGIRRRWEAMTKASPHRHGEGDTREAAARKLPGILPAIREQYLVEAKRLAKELIETDGDLEGSMAVFYHGYLAAGEDDPDSRHEYKLEMADRLLDLMGVSRK